MVTILQQMVQGASGLFRQCLDGALLQQLGINSISLSAYNTRFVSLELLILIEVGSILSAFNLDVGSHVL